MLWAELYPLWNLYAEALFPKPEDMTGFEDTVFKDVTKVKWGHSDPIMTGIFIRRND